MVRKVLGASGALVLLALAVALVPQRGRASDVDNVLVVNGPKRPVPVNGSVGVSGSVNATVTNTPNVNVTGLPAVQLAPGTNVGINGTPSVSVTNTPTVELAPGAKVGIDGPVDVHAVGGAHEPVEMTAELKENFDKLDVLTVPPGKRFVLEDLDAFGVVAPGEKVVFVGLDLGGGKGVAIPLSFSGPFGLSGDYWLGGRRIRGYADAGAVLQIVGSHTGSAGGELISVTISGFLEDV